MHISSIHIIKELTIHQTPQNLYRQWTTHEGLKSFFSSDNLIELRIGGAFEIYFLTDSPYGTKGSEGCKILSYVPDRQLTFSWNAPPSLPVMRNAEHYTWVVLDFIPVEEGRTKVILTHAGWPHDGSWQPMYEYFDRAWEMVLKNLKESNERRIL